jgi:hypothetical protein
LQEGHRPGGGEEGYQGDASFRAPERLTVQVFAVDAVDAATKEILTPNLRGLAVWVPRHLAGGALVQVQG